MTAAANTAAVPVAHPGSPSQRVDTRTTALVVGRLVHALLLNGGRLAPAPRFLRLARYFGPAAIGATQLVMVDAEPRERFTVTGAQLAGRWTRSGGDPVSLYDSGQSQSATTEENRSSQ